jgi:hypothetical protein
VTRLLPRPPAAPAAALSQHSRRAPRLRPEERIAPYITRVGRFRRVDPGRARPLPRPAQILGVLGWAVLLGDSFRRAISAARSQADKSE